MIKGGQMWRTKHGPNKIYVRAYDPKTRTLTYSLQCEIVNDKHWVTTIVPEFFYATWELVEHPIESITTTDGEMFI